MSEGFLEIGNGEVVAQAAIPHLQFNTFREEALQRVKDGAKVVQFFGFEDGNVLKLLCVLRTDKLWIAGCHAPDSYPALTCECEPYHLFERELAEQYGVLPEGHPWLKMVRYHANKRAAPDVFGNDYNDEIPGNYDYYSVAGEEIHEVAVGPVHAGVIEPGHFRFNCIGERVLNLEIHLGYQHRGIEDALPGVSRKRIPIIVEGIAGDTTVANSVCLAQAFEALASASIESGAKKIRTIALELERIANHIGDLGALSGDVAFLPPANYCGRMRGDFLNMTLLLCGNRFGKGLVRPGGVRFTLTEDIRKTLIERIREIKPQVAHVNELLLSTPSVLARFEGCGVVSRQDTEALGLVGPAGRASGNAYDVRRCFSTESYGELVIPENAEPSCDVYARAKVRADEVMQSIELIESLLAESNGSPAIDDVELGLAKSSVVVTVNEAWRGELSHCIVTGAQGEIIRYKIKDPSFHNWNGLSMALRDTGISDFPLNNKSFNLSYCGYDL